MTPVKRYHLRRNCLSLLGMIAVMLFTTELNYQYTSAADPSTDPDNNDPVSVVARVAFVIRGTVGEHLPVVIEEPLAVVCPAEYHPVASLPGQPFNSSDPALPSLRGPPARV